MSEAAFVFLFLVLGVGGPLVLYAAIQSETSNPRVVDRETAEREAQERSGIEGSPREENRREKRERRNSDRNQDRNW